MAGRRTALIVANDRYDNEGLRRLRSPAADAEALARVLGDARIGGFDVGTVHNQPAHEISTRIEDLFSEAGPDDVLLLHFSCHGLKSESGELFFAASTTRPDRLGSTAVAADFVQRCMRASRSRSIVLLLDCCYGGAFSQGVTVRAAGDVDVLDNFRGGGRGRAVITASSSMEYAFEGGRLADDQAAAPSVFTSALVEGLETGDADRDEDGWVSLNELYDYVFDRVRERNGRQTPSRDVQMQGELYLARSRRKRVKPQPIPANLRSAMTDENVYSRMGAVTELRSRLSSEDLSVAAGALEALREVAAADIAYVADAARAAFEDVRTRPAEPAVRFGPGGEATVRLLGPPLAGFCTAETSEPWIRAEVTPEGLLISADTDPRGSRRGEVTVQGPVSAATVTVDLDPPASVERPRAVAPPVAEPPPAERPEPSPVAEQPPAERAEPSPVAEQPPAERAEPSPVAEQPPAERPEPSPVAEQPPAERPEPSPVAEQPPAERPEPSPVAEQPPVVEEPQAEPAPVVAIPAPVPAPGGGRGKITAYVWLAAGVLGALLGLLIFGRTATDTRVHLAEAHLVLYAALWTWHAIDRRGVQRAAPIALAVLAAGTLTWMISINWYYMEIWAIVDSPMQFFWLVAGLVELAATFARRAPAVRHERLTGLIACVFGLAVIYVSGQEAENVLAFLYGYFVVVLAIMWGATGLEALRGDPDRVHQDA